MTLDKNYVGTHVVLVKYTYVKIVLRKIHRVNHHNYGAIY